MITKTTETNSNALNNETVIQKLEFKMLMWNQTKEGDIKKTQMH